MIWSGGDTLAALSSIRKRRLVTALHNRSSLVSERDHRINLRSAACWHETGSQSHSCENERDDDERDRVGSRHSVELICEYASRGVCADQPYDQTCERQRNSVTQNQPEDVSRLR